MKNVFTRRAIGVGLLLIGVVVLPLGVWSLDEHGHDHGDHAAHGEATKTAGHDAHGHDEPGHGEHADEVTLTSDAIARYGIKIEPVRRRAMTASFVAPARVAFNAEAMAHVGTPVEGRVAQLRVRLGDTIARGDVLLIVDSPALGESQSDYLRKAAAVEVARTGLEVARTSYDRSKTLMEGKGLSLGEFQRREGEFRIAQGGLLAAESAALAAENTLHLYGMTQAQVNALKATGEIDARYEVRAPIAGTVVEREATLGEVVGPEREALMILADLSTYWVMADVPEARIARVAVDSPAWVTIAALGRDAVEGRVTYIAPQLNAATRTTPVRVEIAGGIPGLQAGMFGQVEMVGADASTTATVLAVPESAVQTVEGGPAVFVPVPNEENTFAKRAVTVGPRVGRWTPILSGLAEGEPVVVGGSFILKADLGKAGAAHEH
jgi:cobalt-zinc-cadmium efflux system membrane fusion protein